ncbi:MAG: GDSL-type esterase/lipase family protein, partial [Chloroflexota bacterium]
TVTPTPTPARSTPTASPSPTPSPSGTRRPSPSPGAIHYVAIGASDTVGVGARDPATGSWPARIVALLPPGSTSVNLGVSGSLAAQAQREQLPAALRERPTIVTIWLAVNDLNAQVRPLDYAASLASIVDALVAGTDAAVFVGNVPDLRAVPLYAASDPNVLLSQISGYNAAVTAVVGKHPGRAALVDLFTGSTELTSQMTVSPDGFHPSDTGYALIAQRFAEAMRRSGIPLR